METKTTSQIWDLDVIFPGGSKSVSFDHFLTTLAADIDAMREKFSLHDARTIPWMVDAVLRIQDLSARMRQAGAYVSCLNAQDVFDSEAKLLTGRTTRLSAALTALFNQLEASLVAMTDLDFQTLLNNESISPIRFALEERKRRALDKLGSESETLISDLAVDGYHAWEDLYNLVVGRMTLTVNDEQGQPVTLSMGQASNKMSSPDRRVRESVFAKWESAWAAESELAASALNHLAGHRLTVYQHRKWNNVLKEPLDINRMQQATLDSMWSAIVANKTPFVKFLERKAELLGVEKLSYADVDAPLGNASHVYTYDEARNFIVTHFARFDPNMARFADTCFENRWIEAEDRPGKRPGGFCTSFPVSNETRIFVTFSGTPSNLATLAHELGHAYHQHVMRGLPQLAQNYAMNVAETASTFAEAIVADASVRDAGTKADRIALLEDKVGRSIAMFMNIHARFLFETRFYAARKQGLQSAQALNTLMQEAQKEAYADALSSYHPHFWASKMHFYITRVPFYNFPYTFGYLFSSGIYARALAEGAQFAEKYVDLLRDTGRMQVEDLAAKHLGVDLTKPDFWIAAVQLAVNDAHVFLAETAV